MTLKLSLTSTLLVTAATTTLSLPASPTFAAALGNITATTTPANIFDTTGIDSDTVKAVQFTTGDDKVALTSLRMWLSGTDDTDLINISIRANNTGNPDTGNVVTTFFNPAPPFGSGLQIYTLSPENPTATLNRNTTYFLYASIDSTATYSWAIETGSQTPTSDLGWTFGQYLFSSDGGETFGTSSLFNAFEINAVSTNEHGSVVGLLALGLFGGVSALKNRKKN